MSAERLDPTLAARLSAALGDDAWSENPPGPRLRPRGREGLRLAARVLDELSCPWVPVGGGRRPAAPGRLELCTRGHAGILDLWAEDLVARVGAGSTLAALGAQLAPLGMRLPLQLPTPARSTVGGAFAAGERGPRSAANRSLREAVLGLSWVDGAGRLGKAGARVVKNVAGYDMVRLHHGARGAFGVILDLVIKLEPRPEHSIGVILPATAEQVESCVRELRRPAGPLEPAALLWLDDAAADSIEAGLGACLLAEAEGWTEAVEDWADGIGVPAREGAVQAVLDAGWGDPHSELWAWSSGPRSALELWPQARARLEETGVRPSLRFDLQSGHGTLVLDLVDPSARPDAALSWLATESGSRGGRLQLERGHQRRLELSAELERSSDVAAASLRSIETRLKQVFDPRGLLPGAPGTIGGGA